jgi:hypothetical protein
VLNGKDILALGWPAGKVIGLGLQTARDLESRGLSREDVLAELEGIRRDPGGALERGSEGPVAELAREWVSIEAAEASASEKELRAEPLPYHTWGRPAWTMPPGFRWRRHSGYLWRPAAPLWPTPTLATGCPLAECSPCARP